MANQDWMDLFGKPAEKQLLPNGDYLAEAIEGTMDESATGKPRYKVTWQVVEGEHAGWRVWMDCYLTLAAMPMTNRRLMPLGLVRHEQLHEPLPAGRVCRIEVVQREWNGNRYNEVKEVEFVRQDANPFPYTPTQPKQDGEGK